MVFFYTISRNLHAENREIRILRISVFCFLRRCYLVRIINRFRRLNACNVKNVKVSAGAGFIVVLTGEIMTMPGLPKSPAAERIDVTDDGKIIGLF